MNTSAMRAVDASFEELRRTALRVKRERDELLAALRNVEALLAESPPSPVTALLCIRKAIASVEGQS